jgi:hypothetical protein
MGEPSKIFERKRHRVNDFKNEIPAAYLVHTLSAICTATSEDYVHS